MVNYKSLWLTKADLVRIERTEELPPGTLRQDERADGTKLAGAYVSNALKRIQDPRLRNRAEFAIEVFCQLDSPNPS